MTKKLFVFFLALAVVMAFSLSVLAQNIVQGKVEAIDKVAKTVTISGTVYILSVQAARVNAKVGDLAVATVQGNMVTELKILM